MSPKNLKRLRRTLPWYAYFVFGWILLTALFYPTLSVILGTAIVLFGLYVVFNLSNLSWGATIICIGIVLVSAEAAILIFSEGISWRTGWMPNLVLLTTLFAIKEYAKMNHVLRSGGKAK